LVSSGRIIKQDNKLFGWIPTNEINNNDKDGVQQFISELTIHIDSRTNTLNSIFAKLYAPRYLIRPMQEKEESGQENKAYAAYREIVGDSFIKSSKAEMQKPESYSRLIKMFLDENLISLYHTKYGSEAQYESKDSQDTYTWLDNGRLIELSLSTDYKAIASRLLNGKKPKHKHDFSSLVQIGSTLYSTPAVKLERGKQIDKASNEFYKLMEAHTREEKKQETESLKERVNNAGI
ncbi:MAG TPA: hypothetical protein VD794_14825, partial [Flavisolibacter sp.]|nr:hypothetical protein [Flavisolibacter sp.]